MRKGAFSLVELLVVMAIISVLAGLLLPVLGKALEAARATACANKQRQIGVAFSLYADAWRVYPRHDWNCPELSVYTIRWYNLLHWEGLFPAEWQPNGKRVHLWCPSKMPDIPEASRGYSPHGDYGMNVRACVVPGTWHAAWTSPSRIKQPSKLILIGECQKHWNSTYSRYSGGGCSLVTDGNNFDRIAHAQRYTNLLYFDGHVSAINGFQIDTPGSYGSDLPWFNR